MRFQEMEEFDEARRRMKEPPQIKAGMSIPYENINTNSFGVMRQKLAMNNVVAFELTPDNRHVEIHELCDTCYNVELTKEEFGALIEELKALYDNIK